MSSKTSVIVIDDDQWLAEQYKHVLEKAGFAVTIAAHAIEGIDMIDSLHPQVIILDIFMPGPNGVVLIHELKSHSDLADIPIIVCTNSASDLPADGLRTYGVEVVLDKTTMHPSDIVAAVRKVLL
ncbi:response regulator [Candidatus Saccharibacteria bacterium]|nr:MAG: response regulator [Candidatus Saccharibacteria bacterium]